MAIKKFLQVATKLKIVSKKKTCFLKMETSSYAKKLNEEDTKSYYDKLTLQNGTILPDPFSLTEWSDDLKYLPDIFSRDVNTYLIDTPSVYTKEKLKAYKSLEAYDYFVCGHVQECLYNEINPLQEFCFIKTEVRQIVPFLFNLLF